MKELAAASIVILLGLTGAHIYVYTLHRRKFFLYLAVGWFSNLVYILAETRNGTSSPSDFSKILAVTAISTISTIFFFLALADIIRMPPQKRGYWSFVLIAITVAGGIAAVASTSASPDFRAEILTGSVTLVTFPILLSLGISLFRIRTDDFLPLLRNEERFDQPIVPNLPNRESHSQDVTEAGQRGEQRPVTPDVRRILRVGKLALAVSLMAYAFLQPFYPLQFRVIDELPSLLRSLFWISLVLKVVHGAGLPLVVLADFRDTAEALRDRSVAEELGVLTASIEHDVKSPLALIHKEIDNLKAKYQHMSPLTERLNRVLDHAARIKAAASVIPMTREMVEHFHQYAEVLNVVAVIRSAVAAVKKADKRGDLRIDVETVRSEILIHGDRARLTQAFVNLLNNAVEACREVNREAPYVEVFCLLAPDRRNCAVVILDHGGGVSEDNLRQIGRPFFSTKTKLGQNRGIGVFMASRVVRLHRGTLQFKSDGATFTAVTITLPVVVARSREEMSA